MSDSDWLKRGERIDDLQREGFRLIQDPDMFCFGIDAVLLADSMYRKRCDSGPYAVQKKGLCL